MPVSARKIRDRGDAAACLAAMSASGMPLRAWCHAEGVSARSLNIWRVILARSAGRPTAQLRMVELVASSGCVPDPIRVHVGAFRVDVSAGFDDEAFRRVVSVLRQC